MRRAALLAATALLAACSTAPQAPGQQPWTTGRLSLKVEAHGASAGQNLSASFELRGSGERGEMRLLSPLGLQLAHARWGPGQASLDTSEGQQQFSSLDELAQRALGEALPLAAWPDWLAGRPWSAAQHEVQPGGFAQLGWLVDVSRRDQGWVEARRSKPPAVQLRVRLDGAEQ